MDQLNRENINKASENSQKQPGWDIAHDIQLVKQQIAEINAREQELKAEIEQKRESADFSVVEKVAIDYMMRQVNKCNREVSILSSRLRLLEEQQEMIEADKIWEQLENQHKDVVTEHQIQAATVAASEFDTGASDEIIRDADMQNSDMLALNAQLRKQQEEQRMLEAEKEWERLENQHKDAVTEHQIQAATIAASEFDDEKSDFFAPDVKKTESVANNSNNDDAKNSSKVEKAKLRVAAAQKKVDDMTAALNRTIKSVGPIEEMHKMVQIAKAKKVLAEINLNQYTESDGVRFVQAQKRWDNADAALKHAMDVAGSLDAKYRKFQAATAKKALAELRLERCKKFVARIEEETKEKTTKPVQKPQETPVKRAAKTIQNPVETPAERAAREARYMQEMQAKFAKSFADGCTW